ncbi:MAG TPA: aminotransferase class I/II-fold pyridoxal phosphate-dependent enzyme [Microbacteriaceae bacterium]|nr:aminotransferase class I/II-fold pyridoxal phosphate-dependent enzyme [Microbacteriaceae bacterium]
MTALHADPLALLRTRTSSKWTRYPDDVLPMFVAEMDYPLAPVIASHLVELIGRSDVGYDARRPLLGEAFASFAHDAWDWELDPSTLTTTVNVMMAITEVIRAAIGPGDRVVLNTPVYPPFFWAIKEAGGELLDVPLLPPDGSRDWEIDFEALETAFSGGAKAYLLCHPHNPTGLPYERETLERIAELAAQYGVLVVSDEIHGALTHSDAEFVPFLAVSEAARETGIAVTSASKAFNIPGLTAAWWIPGSRAAKARLTGFPESAEHRTSHFGVHASTIAFNEARGWLADVVEAIETNRALLHDLLDEHLPEAVLHEPRASYLAWIDFRPLGWGDNPAKRILDRGRVALTPGAHFGTIGRGFARINFACAPEVLEEGVRRIAAAR